MFGKRVIARLDIKAPNLIKGIHLEGLRVIGDPAAYAREYYCQGADEFIYMDIVASLYGRSSLTELVRATVKDIFIPLTVGGGIRTLKDVENMLHSGADKVAVNTAAVKNPKIITEIANQFGSQCLVLSVEAKALENAKNWEVYFDNGREHSGLDVVQWCKQAQELGAGEILLTSVDREGTRKGYDIPLVRAVTSSVSIPVIASGGCGSLDHVAGPIREGGADAIAIADMLHYERAKISDLKQALSLADVPVRQV